MNYVFIYNIKFFSEYKIIVLFFRTAREISRTLDEIKAQIQMIEREYGSKDELNQELQEKREKYDQFIDFLMILKKSCEVISLKFANRNSYNFQKKILESFKYMFKILQRHQIRLVKRRQLYRGMKKEISEKVEKAFVNVLALRKYEVSFFIYI